MSGKFILNVTVSVLGFRSDSIEYRRRLVEALQHSGRGIVSIKRYGAGCEVAEITQHIDVRHQFREEIRTIKYADRGIAQEIPIFDCEFD